MKTVKEEGIIYLLLPISVVLEEEDYIHITECLATSELATLSNYINAALQERDKRSKKR